MVREAELTGIVKTETDDRALERTASKMEGALDEATQLAPKIDTRSIRRKFERAIPGGGLLGGAIDKLTGQGGAGGGGAGGGPGALGDEDLKIQTAQLEKLDEIQETLEKDAVSGGGGGGGLRGMIPGGAGGGGLLGGLLGGGAAGALGGISLGTLGLGAAGVGGIAAGGWALSDIASGGQGFKEIGDLGEKFQEQFPDLGQSIEDLFTENPIYDLGESIGSGDFSWPELPDFSSLSWPSLPNLSGLSWPSLPDLSSLSFPDLPDLSSLSWPKLPSLSSLSWPSLPNLSDLSWPEVPKPIKEFGKDVQESWDRMGENREISTDLETGLFDVRELPWLSDAYGAGKDVGNWWDENNPFSPDNSRIDGTDIEDNTTGGDFGEQAAKATGNDQWEQVDQTQQSQPNRARNREVVIPVEDNRTIEVNANLRLDNVREQLRREGIDPDVIEEIARQWPQIQRNAGGR